MIRTLNGTKQVSLHKRSVLVILRAFLPSDRTCLINAHVPVQCFGDLSDTGMRLVTNLPFALFYPFGSEVINPPVFFFK